MKRLLIATLFLFGCGTTTPSTPPHDAESRVRTLASEFQSAFNRGDWDAVAGYYTEDAVLLAPHADVALGRPAIGHLFGTFAPLKPRLTLTTDRIVQSCDVAYEYGTYALQTTGTPADRGKFLAVWRRMPNGEWRIAADMFNTSLPATR